MRCSGMDLAAKGSQDLTQRELENGKKDGKKGRRMILKIAKTLLGWICRAVLMYYYASELSFTASFRPRSLSGGPALNLITFDK